MNVCFVTHGTILSSPVAESPSRGTCQGPTCPCRRYNKRRPTFRTADTKQGILQDILQSNEQNTPILLGVVPVADSKQANAVIQYADHDLGAAITTIIRMHGPGTTIETHTASMYNLMIIMEELHRGEWMAREVPLAESASPAAAVPIRQVGDSETWPCPPPPPSRASCERMQPRLYYACNHTDFAK